MALDSALSAMRLDKWLWAARFFKTRSLATEAIDHGRVRLNGARVKPAREVKPGDHLAIEVGDAPWVVVVAGLSMRRGPAPEARQLYSETEASRAARERAAEQRKLAAHPAALVKGRPTKRDRRRIHRFTEE